MQTLCVAVYGAYGVGDHLAACVESVQGSLDLFGYAFELRHVGEEDFDFGRFFGEGGFAGGGHGCGGGWYRRAVVFECS